MSRIGKLPISIPSGVTVQLDQNIVRVKGPKGELSLTAHPLITVVIEESTVLVTRDGEEKEKRSIHGLMRTLIANMVEGVSKGFEKKLEIIGVGYKASGGGTSLNLSLGFSHPVKYQSPKEIQLTVETEGKRTFVLVAGIDKAKVGEVAAKIRSFRPPEPYKGKGIRYVDEYVRRKAGKSGTK